MPAYVVCGFWLPGGSFSVQYMKGELPGWGFISSTGLQPTTSFISVISVISAGA